MECDTKGIPDDTILALKTLYNNALSSIDTCVDPCAVWRGFVDAVFHTLWATANLTPPVRDRIWMAIDGIRRTQCGSKEYTPQALMAAMMLSGNTEIAWPGAD